MSAGAKIEQLRQVIGRLAQYANHRRSCPAFTLSESDCICGFTRVKHAAQHFTRADPATTAGTENSIVAREAKLAARGLPLEQPCARAARR